MKGNNLYKNIICLTNRSLALEQQIKDFMVVGINVKPLETKKEKLDRKYENLVRHSTDFKNSNLCIF